MKKGISSQKISPGKFEKSLKKEKKNLDGKLTALTFALRNKKRTFSKEKGRKKSKKNLVYNVEAHSFATPIKRETALKIMAF